MVRVRSRIRLAGRPTVGANVMLSFTAIEWCDFSAVSPIPVGLRTSAYVPPVFTVSLVPLIDVLAG